MNILEYFYVEIYTLHENSKAVKVFLKNNTFEGFIKYQALF